MKPPIRGFRRVGDSFVPIEPDPAGWLSSEILELSLGLDGRNLVIRDTRTGEVLLTDADAELADRVAEHNSRTAAEAAQRLAEEKIRSLEAELAKFRAGAG